MISNHRRMGLYDTYTTHLPLESLAVSISWNPGETLYNTKYVAHRSFSTLSLETARTHILPYLWRIFKAAIGAQGSDNCSALGTAKLEPNHARALCVRTLGITE